MKRMLIGAVLAIMASLPSLAGNGEPLKGKVLRIDMNETIAERGSGGGFSIDLPISIPGISSKSSVSLLSVERALQKAATDDKIAMVYLNYDNFSAGAAASEEVREYLRRFRESGKPVVAYGCSMANGAYYIASVADSIFMHPKGGGILQGLSSTQYFLKDLLDTLGVNIQLIRHGKYKSAGEMYIRNDISPENRAQYEELLEAIWSGMLEEMASSRNIPADSLRSWMNGLELGTSDTWVDKGLVDGLKYRDEMEDWICGLYGVSDPDLVPRVNLKDYARKVKDGKGSKIAILYADGDIVRSGNGVAGEKFAREVEKIRNDSSVKGVVFRVNSPGGEVVAADIIRREIELLGKEKPVVASYGAYAASGGYLISAGCEKIFTDNATLTGSIGVFGTVISIGDAIRKILKVNVVSVGTDKHSSMGNMMDPLNAEEEAWYQKEIEGIYDDFVGVVADGRKKTAEEVDAIAQGRVWSGKDALKLGLADEKATLMDAVEYVARKAGLEKYKIARYPEESSSSIFSMLMGGSSDKDNPLVDFIPEPGFSTRAEMPWISINF